MLVLDEDRQAFYQFIKNHLTENGVALICTMGDGEIEKTGDINQVNKTMEKIHPESGKKILVNILPARVVSMKNFEKEIQENDLILLESGITEMPGFPVCMYSVVKI